jgi:hypothetical protein
MMSVFLNHYRSEVLAHIFLFVTGKSSKKFSKIEKKKSKESLS